MNEKYEYIRLKFDLGDLSELNTFSSVGFRVVAVVTEAAGEAGDNLYALLERKLA